MKTNGSDRLFEMVFDALEISERRMCPRFVGFMDAPRRAETERRIPRGRRDGVMFYGGYENAQRVLFGAFPAGTPPDESVFPVQALEFSYRPEAKLSHRDFLGTILSCGIEREKVGDILCGEGRAVVFMDSALAGYVAGQISKVGGEGIRISAGYSDVLPDAQPVKKLDGTVASLRLDCVTASAAAVSRETAVSMIKSGRVSVNHEECGSVSRNVEEGNILSIRGVGRFRVSQIGSVTKKGRVRIGLEKYM